MADERILSDAEWKAALDRIDSNRNAMTADIAELLAERDHWMALAMEHCRLDKTCGCWCGAHISVTMGQEGDHHGAADGE